MSPLESRGALDRAGASAFETKSPWDRSASVQPNHSGAPDAATPGYDLASTAAAASSSRNPNYSLGERAGSGGSAAKTNPNANANSNASSNSNSNATNYSNYSNSRPNNYSASSTNTSNTSNTTNNMPNSSVRSPTTANTKNPTASTQNPSGAAWNKSQPPVGPSEPRRSLYSVAAADTGSGVLGSTSASTATSSTATSSVNSRYAGAVESASSMGDGVGPSAAPWQRERIMKTGDDGDARGSGKSNSGPAGSAAASGSNALDAAKSELGTTTGTHNQHPATHPTQSGTTWGAGKDSDATWSKSQRSMSTAASANTAQNGWDSTLYAGHDGEPISKGEFAQFRNDVMGRIKALEERYASATPAPKRDD